MIDVDKRGHIFKDYLPAYIKTALKQHENLITDDLKARD